MLRLDNIDEMTVQIAHFAGTLEARGEIEDMEWNDLRETVAAIINQYETAAQDYWEGKCKYGPNLDDIAKRMLKERYPSPTQKKDTIPYIRKTVLSMERDGFDVRTLILNFEIPHKDFDLFSAVKAASLEYCQTSGGKETFIGNCNCFNWADFDVHVPDELCEKYGFRKVPAEMADSIVNFNKQLVDESDVLSDEDDD